MSDKLTGCALMKTGGSWLGAARSCLQWHAHNGSNLQWGSQEAVRGLTVRDIEYLAACAAAADRNANQPEIDSLKARIAELEARERWIPVTERLPEQQENMPDGVSVNVLMIGEKIDETRNYDVGFHWRGQWHSADASCRLPVPTHWKPIHPPESEG